MAFLTTVVRVGSLAAAGRELGLSAAAVSKRLTQMEARLGVRLLNRTTRRLSPTHEGETYLTHARAILASIDDMERTVRGSSAAPRGLLRVNASPGFGRRHIAPLIDQFARQTPQVHIQFQLTVDPPALTDDAYDVCIRFGEPPDTRVIARRLARNQRVLCAAPEYLRSHGLPKVPHDLSTHQCICIRQGGDAYGVWRFFHGKQQEAVKVRGALSTSDGEIAVNWALSGHGIVLRSYWDVADYLTRGQLVQVLPSYPSLPADIVAVYPETLKTAARVRAFVDFLATAFAASPIFSRLAP